MLFRSDEDSQNPNPKAEGSPEFDGRIDGGDQQEEKTHNDKLGEALQSQRDVAQQLNHVILVHESL